MTQRSREGLNFTTQYWNIPNLEFLPFCRSPYIRRFPTNHRRLTSFPFVYIAYSPIDSLPFMDFLQNMMSIAGLLAGVIFLLLITIYYFVKYLKA